ncbi:zinc-dependent metalloprotease [Propionibacteriaceae bacterium Y1685]|uniref:zinc-dependent metalloprotease n=1 Tax=Microlunatus sp. Y1700 TaxID=3418487 RepID=UPI003B7BC1CE
MSASTVDWSVAEATAKRLVRPGPDVSHAQAAEAVEDLRAAATKAEQHVAEVTGLEVTGTSAPVLVVDRANWVSANIDAFAEILAPLNADATAWSAVTTRISGVEVGALMSYLAGKILGQFDPYFTPPSDAGGPGGRLLLVAPNIVAVERELKVDKADFRLWVCLHEETHRVQFTHSLDGGTPWLRDHLRSMINELVSTTDLDAGALASMVRTAAGRFRHSDRSEMSLIDLVQGEEQRELVDRITAIMSLLEGHADVIMDDVGPAVIPSVARIRASFDRRRKSQGIDRVFRRLIGMDAKMRQYEEGAAFCRAVLAKVGMSGLNEVFTSPETLPSMAEIATPQGWLDRVHG